MKHYTAGFKARVLQRLVGPRAISAYRLSAEVGVSQVTLSRWLAAARSVPGMTTPAKKWTGAQKLRVVLAAHGLSETDLGTLLRREGLHAAQLDEWRAAAETALEDPSRRREKAVPHPDTQRLAEVERELRRKEKALAEAAALLVLKKKVEAYWGDADDTTAPTSDR
jgi:transposase